MPNKMELKNRGRADSVQMEVEAAHYVGSAILLAAAGGFLQLAVTLDRVLDFSRFAY